MFANEAKFGGPLVTIVEKELKTAKDAAIASGYVSHDVILQFRNDFYRIAENDGRFRLLIGMAFFEGMSAKNLRDLSQIESDLSGFKNGSGIYVAYNRRFHGKVYRFNDGFNEHFYVGSSNFSRSGLVENLECTAEVVDELNKRQISSYLDFLFDPDNAVTISKAEITVPGSDAYKKRIALSILDDLERYDPTSIDKSRYPSIPFPLGRIADKEKSNLNAYFGKGRWSRATGKIVPRHWYETELIANRDITSNPLFPKGKFTAYTDDGYIMPMVTNGDYFKNIRSRGNLQLLGQWIKGKLQKANALIPLTPVTHDTLDLFGRDSIVFYKLADDKYYMEF